MIQRVIFWLLFIPVLAGIWYVVRLAKPSVGQGVDWFATTFGNTALIAVMIAFFAFFIWLGWFRKPTDPR